MDRSIPVVVGAGRKLGTGRQGRKLHRHPPIFPLTIRAHMPQSRKGQMHPRHQGAAGGHIRQQCLASGYRLLLIDIKLNRHLRPDELHRMGVDDIAPYQQFLPL